MFNFIKRYIKRNYGIDKEYYRFIDDMFGFVPGNIELYKVALIHKSASQSIGGHHINNERLEYLGDAVIESITSDYLFIAYPDRDEGFLTQMRSKIVSRQSLNEMAVCVGLDKYLICKSGATLQQKHIYGDAFEAMMGAIYLDKGYEFTNRLLINDIYERFLSIDELSEHESDFKSRLIEWCQKNRHSLEFRTSKGIDRKSSAPIFYTTVFIDRIEMGHGTGDSKKSSEQSAACSVTREMSDEECAKLLDKFDKLMDGEEQKNLRNSGKGNRAETANKPETDNGGNKPAEGESKGEGRRRRGRKRHNSDSAGDKPAAAEPEVKAESATDVETLPTEEPSQPKRSRRGRKKSAETATEEPARQSADNAEAESAAADPAPQTETAEQTEQTAKRRRGGRKRSEQTAAETPADIPASVAEEPAGESESQAQAEDKKPAKRRRSPRKKTEPTAETAATESAATTEAAAAEQEAQPAKRRRTRRKKTEPTAEPEQAAASAETNAEAPAATD